MQIPPILIFDGSEPAPGTTALNVSRPVHPPIRGDPMRRDPLTLAAVLNQFAVAHNPRYEVRDTSGDGRKDSHCDAFAADACDALGVVLPQWAAPDGAPQPPGHGFELGANGMADWLEAHGTRYGWRRVEATAAQDLANLGHPVLVTWRNPSGGSGHIALVRPAGPREDGPVIAQAGARRFNRGTVAQGFGEGKALGFWANDTGGTLSISGQWTPPAALVEQALAELELADAHSLDLAAALFQRLTTRQGLRSGVTGVKLPDFPGCSPLVRANWLDVAEFVLHLCDVFRRTGQVSPASELQTFAAQQRPWEQNHQPPGGKPT